MLGPRAVRRERPRNYGAACVSGSPPAPRCRHRERAERAARAPLRPGVSASSSTSSTTTSDRCRTVRRPARRVARARRPSERFGVGGAGRRGPRDRVEQRRSPGRDQERLARPGSPRRNPTRRVASAVDRPGPVGTGDEEHRLLVEIDVARNAHPARRARSRSLVAPGSGRPIDGTRHVDRRRVRAARPVASVLAASRRARRWLAPGLHLTDRHRPRPRAVRRPRR